MSVEKYMGTVISVYCQSGAEAAARLVEQA